MTDPIGRDVSFEYDTAGRVTKQTLPGNRDIIFTYDTNGNVASITPPGSTAHAYSYNSVDRAENYNPPDVIGIPQDITLFTHNLDKQLEFITRPDGQIIDFVHTGTGNLDLIVIPGDPWDCINNCFFKYEFDSLNADLTPNGHLSKIIAPDGGSLSFTYDGPLNLSTRWLNSPVDSTVSQVFDNFFRVTSRTVDGANTVNFSYDNDSLLVQAGSQVLTRDALNGFLTSTTQGTLTDSYTYDGFGDIDTYNVNENGSSIYFVDYDWDQLGRVIKKTETVLGVTHVFDYVYNTEGFLERVDKDTVSIATYTYDSNGNRLSKIHPVGTTTGTFDAQDRQITYGATSYTYTANGELLTRTDSGGTATYHYDVLGNLLKVDQANGDAIKYLVDGRERRYGKSINGTLEKVWVYKDQLNPVAELDGAGNLISRFVYSSKSNVPDFMIRGGATYRIISDQLGSPILVVNTANGQIDQQIEYDEFGNVFSDTNPGFQPFGFAGGMYDPDTKLVHFGARDYDPEIGRWTSKDPVQFVAGDPNLYGYIFNDPLNAIDPLGLGRFGKRPLDGTENIPIEHGGPLADFFNLEINHEQYFFDNGKENLGFFGDDRVRADNGHNKREYEFFGPEFDDQLIRKAIQNVDPGNYNLVLRNCQHWADKVRNEYERLKNEQ